MKDRGQNIETGWLPLRDSYEEAVLTWYEQIENSFRRREQDARRPVPTEATAPVTAKAEPRRAFD
jgi:hypothetical protein